MKTTLLRNMLAAMAALFTALFALPQQAVAENYDLWIANVQVTSANCGDLSVIPGVTGTVKYDHSTKILTLNNATINTEGDNNIGILSYIDGLTVRVKRTVNVTAQEPPALSFKNPATLTGGGTLNATSSENCGIYVCRTRLTLDSLTVNAKGKWGIAGWDGTFEDRLTVKNAAVTAEGNGTDGSLLAFSILFLEGCRITQPAGAAFDASLKGVALDGQLVTEKVTIERTVKNYDLWIGGEQVTSLNCGDLSGIYGVSGIVKYDTVSKTLSLQDAVINGASSKGIYSGIDGLKVSVRGTNTVMSVSSAVHSSGATTFKGKGTLNALSINECGIYVGLSSSLTIEDCTVNARGKWGIVGRDGASGALTVRNATVTAEGDGTKSPIRSFKTFSLMDCVITSPAGARWDIRKQAVTDASGNEITAKVTIMPVTFYDLKIAGERVHSVNCGDLSVIPGVTGTVKYDHSTKTLTLDDAAIAATGNLNAGIWASIDGLTVQVKGTVNVKSQEREGILFSKPATLTGGGTLNTTGGDNDASCGIFASETNLTIDGLTVNAKGKWGIAGNDGLVETLTIRNATVRAEGDGTDGSLLGFKRLTLKDCVITQPAGAAFDASLKGVALDGQLVTEQVTIEPATFYDLKIAGTQVFSLNCGDLSVIPGVTGTVFYDPATKTLTLENATIAATDRNAGIEANMDGLFVSVKGTVNVTAQNSAALLFWRKATLLGDGTLNVTSSQNPALHVSRNGLTLDGLTVRAKGKWGITGYDGSAETLTVRNAAVMAEGTEGSICNLKVLTLKGCLITQPAGAAFDASLKGVALDGQLVTEQVTIEPLIEYDLKIAGTQVTSLNCADLSVIPGVTGTASYDPATKTLTLEDAAIDATGRNRGIEAKIDGLTIQVTGTVNITSQENSGIMTLKPATLTGDGTLHTTSGGECGIYASETDLTLDGLTVNAKGKWGIAGNDGLVETLTIKNANVSAEGDGTDGSLLGFKSLTLDGCEITQPTGAAFDASLRGVALGGQLVKTKVEITRIPNAISAPTSGASLKRQGIYNLRGVRMQGTLESLPAGVYI